MWQRWLKDVKWWLKGGSRTVLRTEPGVNSDLRNSCRNTLEAVSTKESLHELKERLLSHGGLPQGCRFVVTRFDGEVYSWDFEGLRVTYLRTTFISKSIFATKTIPRVVVLKVVRVPHR
jgi:hypothetical protein